VTLGKFVKAPAERKRYTIDYSEWLDTGETILTVAFDVEQTTDGTPVDPLEIDAYEIGDPATDVVFFAALGDALQNYTVTVTITTSGGQTKEDTLLFLVRNA
jgi:hypothetical protein